jgi:RecA-family ATPase
MAATENTPMIQQATQWALEDLFKGQQPSQEDLTIIAATPAIAEKINGLCDALKEGGEPALRKAFNAFCKDIDLANKASGKKDNWLRDLRNKEVPPRAGTEGEQAEEQKPKRRIRFVDDDVIENMPAREWLVTGLLPRNGVCILFGLPGTYKSFLAIDLALSIGFGRGWQGRKVRKGGVAYIAGEGFAGLGTRSKAWKAFHRMQGKSGVKWYGDSIDLTEPASVNELYEALDEDFIENPLELIIIDTFSRNSGGAEENSNTDVKKFMHTADLLQKKYGCTILIIHHCGKNPDKGPRGASAFTGDTETIISVDHFSNAMQGIKIGCFKQKDAESFDPIHLALHKVQYGELSEESSLVLVKTDVTEENDNPLASAKKSEQIMYEVLRGKELTLTDWVALGIARGISESSAKKARKELYEVRQVIGYKKEGKLYYALEDKAKEQDIVESEKPNE